MPKKKINTKTGPEFSPVFLKPGTPVYHGFNFSVEIDGITFTATIHQDDNNDAPDKNDDGYWPSKNPNDCGYIGKRARPSYKVQMAQATKRMELWREGSWCYYGVVITAEKCGVELLREFDHALWGIEGNWPTWKGMPSDDYDNTLPVNNNYLHQVANELLPEAIEAAKAKLAELAQ